MQKPVRNDSEFEIENIYPQQLGEFVENSRLRLLKEKLLQILEERYV